MSFAILFHFLCAQHVSDINISIIRSLRLFCWITTLVVLFLVWCVLEFRCGWVGVVSVLQAEACNTDNKMFVKFVQQGISKRYMERFIEYMEYFCYGNTKFCVVINMVIKNFLTSWWKSFTLNFNQFFETSYEMNRDARV